MVKLKFVIRNGVLALRISAGEDRFYKRVAHLMKGEPDLRLSRKSVGIKLEVEGKTSFVLWQKNISKQ